MVDSELFKLKLVIARKQLGTALHLFIENKDPISVHSLACAAGEILDELLKSKNQQSFSKQAAELNEGHNEATIRSIRNKHWNAFKHLNDKKGFTRNDETLIKQFSDDINDHALYIGWDDYSRVAGVLPIGAQIFQCWFYAMYEEKLATQWRENAEWLSQIKELLPNVPHIARVEQKTLLRNLVNQFIDDKELLSDSKTENQPLLYDA